MNNWEHHGEDQEFSYDVLDAFIEMLGYKLSEPRTHILNPRRIKELEGAYDALSKIVLDISPDAKITCEIGELSPTHASIRIETDELVVGDIKAFISAVENASNFEMYPLNSGKMRMAFMFFDVMYAI